MLLTVVGVRPLVAGRTLIGQDSAAYYYPAYAFLGEQLRGLDLPIWNPFWLGGAPFAADPQSGWMYLPAMILFAVLPLGLAVDAFIIFHLLLAGLATYALARALGIGPGGAAVAATAFEFTGVVYSRAPCCPGYYQVASWIPAMLFTAERALQAESWRGRLAWWTGSGFALSQVLAIWLGQGTIYAFAALGSFLAYRSLFGMPSAASLARHCGAIVLHGAAISAVAVGFAAAGLLPRLEFHARSNLADGYTGNLSWAATIGGWDLEQGATELLSASLYDVGAAAAALALVGAVIARRRFGAPYFALLTVAGLALASNTGTRLAATLPIVGELHGHYPERVMMVAALGPAILAGAAVAAAPRVRLRTVLVWALAAAVLLAYLSRDRLDLEQSNAVRAAATAGVLLIAVALTRVVRLRPALTIIAAVVIFFDLYSTGIWFRDNGPYGGFHRVNIDRFYAPTGAAEFLQAQDGNGRFFGYDPALHRGEEPRLLYYRYHFAEPAAMDLIVNNRGAVFGIEDVQGYNPIQLQRYVEFIDAVNGQSQEYHGSYVLPSGVRSPLLNLLGARFVIVPAQQDPARADLAWLREHYPIVYADEDVLILENPHALPRAWIVHDARQVAAGAALDLLASGAVDPRRTALLESSPPTIGAAADGAEEEATIVEQSPTVLRIRTRADAPGLLVVGVNYYPSWQATVDGASAETLVADHVFTAIPVPAGEHVVELRQESQPMQMGLAITGITTAATLGPLSLPPVVAAAGRAVVALRRRRVRFGWRRLLAPARP